jgi:hypothetical protein
MCADHQLVYPDDGPRKGKHPARSVRGKIASFGDAEANTLAECNISFGKVAVSLFARTTPAAAIGSQVNEQVA